MVVRFGRRRQTIGTPPFPEGVVSGEIVEVVGEDGLAPYEKGVRGQMEAALETYGSIRAAAKAIGMPKSTFADKAKAWNLRPRRKIRIVGYR